MSAATETLKFASRSFQVDDHNRKQLSILCGYFGGLKSPVIDLNKGILLFGNVGSGKSVIMKSFRLITNSTSPFGMKHVSKIAFEYSEEGAKAMKSYTMPYNKNLLNHYCFDDLGVDTGKSYFGNKVNVMAEIIEQRYEEWQKCGLKTHFTTNMTGDEMRDKYGDRVHSRLSEMCEWIPLHGTDRRVQK